MNHHDYKRIIEEFDEYLLLTLEDYGYNSYQCFWLNQLSNLGGGREEFSDWLREFTPPTQGLMKHIGRFFDPEKIKLVDDLGRGTIDGEGNIEIDSGFSTSERVKVLLHELLHFHPRYRIYTQCTFDFSEWPFRYRREEVELQMDADAKNITEQRPLVVKYLCDRLGWN